MPEPNHRPACRLEEGLGSARLSRLIEQRAVIAIECDNCNRRADWSADHMQRRLGQWRDKTIGQIAPRLRCSRCRSRWLHVWRADESGGAARLGGV